jgi:uncharacterized protein involved in exopolysaccharide biosynthesis
MVVSTKPRLEDEVTLSDLFAVLWRGRWFIVGTTAAITVVAGIAAFVTPKSYRAQVVLSPVSSVPGAGELGGALGSLASQFGGLASLAGISVGGDSKREESIAVLQSEALTRKYIQDNDLLPTLYSKRWDAEKGAWKPDNPKKIPTLWQANQFFKKKIRNVTTDAKTGLVTLSITWKDATTAAKWANDLVEMTNNYLRTKAIQESERNILYLNDQAAKTKVVEGKQAIYKILETEINKVMLARGSNEYAFRIVDPAVAPEKAHSPQKLIWLLAGMFGGACLSAFIVLARSSSRAERE